jgi:ABC-2 type transport system permease protein
VTGARVFFVGGVLSFRALFGFMTPWIFVPSLLVTPIFQILLFVYMGRSADLESDEFYVIGNALQYASVPCLFAMSSVIAGERNQQTLSYILISPAPRLPLFLGRAVPVAVNGFFVAAFALLVAGLLLGIDVPASALGPIAIATAATTLSCTGLGLLMAGLGLLLRETAVLGNVVFGLLLIFTGANVPLDQLPGWMSTVAQGLPYTHGIEAARRLADGASLGSVGGLIGAELLLAALYAVAGYGFIRATETLSRRLATLDRA